MRDYERYKAYLTDYVNSITSPSKGKDMYICPLCNSGNGENHTGAFHLKEGTKWRCYSCEQPRNASNENVYGDIYDLYRLVNHLESNEQAFDEIAKLYDGVKMIYPTDKRQEEKSRYAESDIDFDKWHIDLLANKKAMKYLDDRRITLDTINRHNLGFRNEYVNNEWKEVVIIPMNENGYVRRAINDKSFKRYNKNVVMSIIDCVTHEKEPIFIVEGWANAFTLEQMGYNAISLNGSGTNNIRMALDYAKGKDNAFICMIDDDKKEQNERLYEMLKEQGNRTMKFDYDMIDRHFYGEKKDVNDYYASEDKLERTHINRIVKEASEKAKDLALETQSDNKEAITPTSEKEALKAKFERFSSSYYLKNSFINDLKESKGQIVSSGYSSIDREMGGGLAKGLYIIGAVSSLGKTTFVLNMSVNIAKQKRHVLFFSLEMDEMEMNAKTITLTIASKKKTPNERANSIGAKEIMSQKYKTEKELQEVKEAINDIENGVGNYLHFIPCNFDMNIEAIQRNIEDFISAYNTVPVVVIDYLQIIPPTRPNASDKQNIDEITRNLKIIQSKYNMIMFVISSFNRESYLLPCDRTSFKESGTLEYSANVMWGLQLQTITESKYKNMGEKEKTKKRELINKALKETPRMIKLVCLKNRFGSSYFESDLVYYNNCDYIPDDTRDHHKEEPREKQNINYR